MFQRDITKKLDKWVTYADRKPLVLRGARQVGKTVAVNMLGQGFDRFIYLNLDIQGESDIFRRRLPVREIFQAILLRKRLQQFKGRTLLFLDEIQNCPEAVESLRYFHEELPEIYVIAAGSLPEIALHENHITFPVGRVEHLFMYPLSFREFLSATDTGQALEVLDTIPLPDFAHDVMIKKFHRYALIGGMPEVVAKYIKENDVTALNSVYDSLLASYMDDAGKYARNPTMNTILRHCIETAPFIAGQRISFAGFGESNYRSREVGDALRTLQRAMVINLLYPSSSVKVPVVPNLKKSPRLQYLDSGLLNYFAGLQEQYFLYDDLHAFHVGILAKHIVGQELICMESNTRKKPCFWVRDKSQSQAEVDFLLQHHGYAIPVEIRSGATGRLRSLHQFMDKCPHNYAVRLYLGNLEIQQVRTPAGKEFHLLNMPYFLTSAIYQYLDWMIDKAG